MSAAKKAKKATKARTTKTAAKAKPAAKVRSAKRRAVASDAAARRAAPTVTRETLNGTVSRAVALLKAIGTSDPIRAAMSLRGYDDAEHEVGWSLVHRASGYRPGMTVPPPSEGTASDAIRSIDAEDEDTFRVVKATLTRRFPAQASFVLRNLAPSKGAAAVVGMHALLDRLDMLESGKGREATRAGDHAAMALLAKRGITPEFRARMRAEVQSAETFERVPPPSPDAVTRDDTHLANLEELRGWFEEWAEIARVAIKRRDYLIRMGLAQRKRTKSTPKGQPAKPEDDHG